LLTRTAPVATLSSLIALSFARDPRADRRELLRWTMLRHRVLQMEHLVDHLRNDLLPTVQGEDAIVPEGVTQRSADVDEIEAVVTVFVGKGCDDAAISVTDDRRVVSDCADIIEFGGSFVPVSVDRQIQQERDSSAVSSPSVA